jgi:hypothetical protein
MTEHLQLAIDELKTIIESPEYETCYDIYDKGATSADAIQVAIEGLRLKCELAIEQIRDFRP